MFNIIWFINQTIIILIIQQYTFIFKFGYVFSILLISVLLYLYICFSLSRLFVIKLSPTK